jgi:hypothetical protein
MDNLIICSHCGSDACYIEEITSEIKTQFCYGCGFQTNSLMKEGEEFLSQQKEVLPELYKDLFFTDTEGQIWMPSTINVPTNGMIFANGNNAQNWMWSAVKAIPVTEEEKYKFPIPKQPGKFYEYRMDMESLQHFDERDFIEALDYIGLLTK